jgi:hypothetical protein
MAIKQSAGISDRSGCLQQIVFEIIGRNLPKTYEQRFTV